MYVGVVLNIPLNNIYTYKLSKKHELKDIIGRRVLVKFGTSKKLKLGIIVKNILQVNYDSSKIKLISEFYDSKPLITNDIMYISKWISSYYICSIGEVLHSYLPNINKVKKYIVPDYSLSEYKFYELNGQQSIVYNTILNKIKKNKFHSFLIHGITGSGKTEVYKHLTKHVIKTKQVLILFPEIVLSAQTIGRFKSSFGDCIAVIHSKLNPQEKLYNWINILDNKVKIILGVRSAILIPTKNIGLIIIDESHDSSFKSASTPRYNAIQVAYKIAKERNISLVLGTATPNIESYYYALNNNFNQFSLLRITDRPNKNIVNEFEVIDKCDHSTSILSPKLISEIYNCVINLKKQCILFVNKRGYASFIICTSCGSSFKCINCNISLTYHKNKDYLLCHYCSYTLKEFSRCKACYSDKVKLLGFGIEKIIEILNNNFPNIIVDRLDFDTTRKKGSYDSILNKFKDGKTQVLIGTQMITKGLHFPNVFLVGIILADIGMNLPDFRALEKVFSLLYQVSGRAGRSITDSNSKVIVQTYIPKHYVIKSLINKDYEMFYEKEIELRKQFLYPPFTRIARFIVRGKEKKIVILNINKLYTYIINHNLLKENKDSLIVYKENPCPLEFINNNYRRQIVIKSYHIKYLNTISHEVSKFFLKIKKVYIEIDIDPQSML